MKINRQSKIIMIGMLGFLALLLMVGSAQAVSVDLEGWNFSADLGDQWQSNSNVKAERYDFNGGDSRSLDYLEEHNMNSESPNFNNWKGVLLSNAFWLPQENANVNPQDLPSYPTKQNGLLANVDIMVHKVPDEVRNWNTHDILLDLYGAVGTKDSVKDIEFNGRPALLVENNDNEDSLGSIGILITDDTVVSIDVVTLPESDLRAWDVIEKFTISKN
jgi:hypothetical protein